MPTIIAEYLGELSTKATHVASNTSLITDAPVDNQGKGQSFSPTDLVATALATCAMTIIGIYAQANNVDVIGTKIEVNKIMASDPRRIGRLEVTFFMPAKDYSEQEKTAIENAFANCPVFHSLSENTEKVVKFVW